MPGILLSSFSSLFKDFDRPRSTRLLVLFPFPGVGSRGSRPVNNGSVGAQMWLSSQASLFPNPVSGVKSRTLVAPVLLFLVVAGQNRPRDTFGWLVQVIFVYRGGWAKPVPRHVWPVSSGTPPTSVSPNHRL